MKFYVRETALVLVAIVFAIGAVFAGFKAASPSTGRQSGLESEPRIVDFGDVFGGVQSQVVTLRNRTPASIQIVKVQQRCDCTAVFLSSSVVPANGETQLRLDWDTRGKHGKSATQVDVLYAFQSAGSSEIRAKTTVEIKGFVTPDVEPAEDKIRFPVNQPAQRTVTFQSPRRKQFRLTEASCDQVDLSASIVGPATIEVEYRPPASPSSGAYSLTVKTDTDGTPVLQIPIVLE